MISFDNLARYRRPDLTLARHAYAIAYARLALTGDGWEAQYRTFAEMLAVAASDYVDAVRAAAAGTPIRQADDLAEARKIIRSLMADCGILDRRLVSLGLIRPDGLDADIAKLCGVP